MICAIVYNASGVLLEYKSFDFYSNASYQVDFQTFLNSQPTGTIIAAAVSNTLCNPSQITNDTHNALSAYGATVFRSTGYRNSYAIIGVKGGSALENYTTNGTPSEFLARNFIYKNNSKISLSIIFECFLTRLFSWYFPSSCPIEGLV